MSLTTFLLVVIGLVLAVLIWRSLQPVAGIVFPKDDPALQAAKAEARASLPQFWSAFDARHPDDSEFGLKVNLKPGEPDGELIWALDIERNGERISGILGNRPVDRAYAEGQRVEIDPAAIVDWCYFRDGVAQGHFTTRAMFPHMPARMVAEGKAALGWA
ncbi:DUF2314 domain-containing protein [Sphingomonas lacunae]|uniref:DUF2314 domain-containing protein n=1 Tax=Sphingomonas lacunae TaxID=2698828 RepID=A0A6M4AR90_9SPHN|nr:DUF2314 domain-containing protein [Sphingomonas lacunae]QJQ31236.1 DUF2314 domain-containing protein [Sphingomonas lacunae]